jgi:hypothetical protein
MSICNRISSDAACRASGRADRDPAEFAEYVAAAGMIMPGEENASPN